MLLMPVHAFISTWGGTAIGPLWLWKSWKEILLVGLFILFVSWVVMRSERWKSFFADKLVLVIALYAGLTIIDAAIHFADNGLEATAVGVAMNLRYLLAGLLAYALFRYSDISWEKWKSATKKFLLAAGVMLAVVGIVQVTVVPNDFLSNFGYGDDTIAPATLIDDNPEAPRAFATLRGPNDYGAFLILPFVLALGLAIKKQYRYALAVVLLSFAFLASSSRSAWLGAAAAVIALGFLIGGKELLRSKRFVAGALAGFVLVVGLFVAALTIPAVQLAVFHSSPDDPSLIEGSTEAHWQSTTAGIERVIANPLGCGPGCAGPASYYGDDPRISENYFVQLAEETGVLGLLTWLVIAGIVARRLYVLRADYMARALLATFVGLNVIGLWLHVWADDPLSIVWWSIAGALLGAQFQTGKKPPKTVS